MFIIKILVLVGLIQLLLATNKPFFCATIYAGMGFLLGLMWGRPIDTLFVPALMAFALSSIYFHLLDRFEGSGILWWIIMAGGFAIGLV